MAYLYPYGDTQQLNLDWLIEQWNEVKSQIDGSLQAEIDRVEAAMTDLYAARDAAAASKTAAQTAATNAASSETVATQQATLAQSYANTAQNQAGIATAAAEAAGNSASSASNSASNANLSKVQAGNSATAAGQSATLANDKATAAGLSAAQAGVSATNAAGSAEDSEAWAVGERGGSPVASGDDTYENNSKYYADQAATVAASIPADYTELSDDVSELKTAISVITGNEEIAFTNNGYIKTDAATVDVTSPVTNSNYRYAVVPCKEGDWFAVNVDGAGAARAWAFVANDGIRVSVSASNLTARSILRAPKNSAYLVLNCKSGLEYIPSYVGLLDKYKSDSVNEKINAMSHSDSWEELQLNFEKGNLQLITGGTISFNSSSKGRVRSVPNLQLFVPKGSIFYINDTSTNVQFFVLKQDLNGNITAGTWSTNYIVEEDAYFTFCLRYSDDSTITDPEQLASKFTIKLAPYSLKTIQRTWKNRWFFDVSHRGYMYEAPESTVASLCRAKAKGYNTVECDLRITSDGEIVVNHNDGMTSNSSYLISEHTLAELRSNANMGTYNGITQQILTFEDLVKIAKDLDMCVFVELKATFTTSQIANIITTAKKYDMKKRVYWMSSYKSSNHDYVGNFRNVDPTCNILVYDTTDASNVEPFVVDGENITFCYARVTYITNAVVQNMANIGVDTIAWCVTFEWLLPSYTEEQVIQKIYDTLDCGVRGMCLDRWTTAELIVNRYNDYF